MKQAYLSELAGQPLISFLKDQGYKVSLVNMSGSLYDSDDSDNTSKELYVDARVATHADLYMCQLGLWDEAGLFFGDPERLTPDYPGDVIYNAVCTRDYYIHLIPGTDEDLAGAVMMWRKQLFINEIEDVAKRYSAMQFFPVGLPEIIEADPDHELEHLLSQNEYMKVIGVNQGYTRCTCLPVDNNSFITSDEGLAKVLEGQGADVLQISPGHILLPGFDYGFIGGCAGHIYVKGFLENIYPEDIDPESNVPMEQRAIIFNGDLTSHPDSDRIIDFIQTRNILPVYFTDYPLEDIGSILAIE